MLLCTYAWYLLRINAAASQISIISLCPPTYPHTSTLPSGKYHICLQMCGETLQCIWGSAVGGVSAREPLWVFLQTSREGTSGGVCKSSAHWGAVRPSATAWGTSVKRTAILWDPNICSQLLELTVLTLLYTSCQSWPSSLVLCSRRLLPLGNFITCLTRVGLSIWHTICVHSTRDFTIFKNSCQLLNRKFGST